MPTVIHRPREQLEQQPGNLLASVHMTYTELKERAQNYSLSTRELDVWHTIQGLDYLLQDDC